MLKSAILSLLVALAHAHPKTQKATKVHIPDHAPSTAGVPLENFVSFSIEFSYFPDFAGNATHPNTFSNNLLENIAHYSGAKPYVRVGGSSQDNAHFAASQQEATTLTFATPDADQPAHLTFGPAFFESYHTWPNTTFVHGFNLKANTTADREAVIESAQVACRSLRGQLLAWQLGNEPDGYGSGLGGPSARPAGWNEVDYVTEWLNLTSAIRQSVQTACPKLAAAEWYAPSFAASPGYSQLEQIKAWQAGLDSARTLKVFDTHHYQAVATDPGITLKSTLLNHSATADSINILLNQSRLLHAQPDYPSDLPFIVGEGNSLARQGRLGLSNTFGAALWTLDANLLMASNNISRFHMHQGTNYRYQAWQPVDTNRTTIGTKAPYYGNIAVAAFLGDLTKAENRPQVVNIPLAGGKSQAAYASFVRGELAKVTLINLQDYNTTVENEYRSTSPRRSKDFALKIPSSCNSESATLQRLLANGSDAVTGVTFDGYSYNHELDNGKPVLLGNVTHAERIKVGLHGVVNVEVPDSSAVLLSF